jgi:hypothetical protein
MSEQSQFDKPRPIFGDTPIYHTHDAHYNDPHSVFKANRGRWTRKKEAIAYIEKPKQSRDEWRRLKDQSEAIDAAILAQRKKKELLRFGVKKL